MALLLQTINIYTILQPLLKPSCYSQEAALIKFNIFFFFRNISMKSLIVIVVLTSTVLCISHAMQINDIFNTRQEGAREESNDRIFTKQTDADVEQCFDFLMPCSNDTKCCGNSKCVKMPEFEQALCMPQKYSNFKV